MSRLAKILIAVIAALWLLMGVVLFTARACECCAEPVVKVEWDGRLWTYDTDMNDGSILVTGNERVICYEVVSGTAITEIRTKAGQDIECIYPQGEEQARGCIEAGRHDLSSVWFCNSGPTAVEMTSFTAETELPTWVYMAAFVFGMSWTAIALVVGVVMAHRIRR